MTPFVLCLIGVNFRPALAGRLRYHLAGMLRISWPLALFLAVMVALIARRPRLLLPILVVFGIWFVVQTVRGRRR